MVSMLNNKKIREIFIIFLLWIDVNNTGGSIGHAPRQKYGQSSQNMAWDWAEYYHSNFRVGGSA
jgi:hypothetical protein